jgi:hypothetical protein
MANKYETEYSLTDPATNQYGRRLTKTLFQFKEDGKDETLIHLDSYQVHEIESAINSFGYSLFEPDGDLINIYDEYRHEAPYIMAECIFELGF